MKQCMFCLFTSLLFIGSALAQDHPPIDQIRDFLRGDTDLWPTFERCAPEFANCALAAGQVSLNNRAYDDAEQYYLQAIEQGSSTAVLALIKLGIERDSFVEVVAWTRLALQQPQLSEHANRWLSEQLFSIRRQLRGSKLDQGNELGGHLIAKWLPILIEDDETSEEDSDCPPAVAIERVQPSYPSILVDHRISGWSYSLIEVNEQGYVSDQISILYTNLHFQYATTQALSKWRYQPLPPDSVCEPRRYNQILHFEMK